MSRFVLTREQVRLVDQRAIESWGMSGLVLMENAGRGCADVLCGLGIAGSVAICCGGGNNAGDGFVIARHLEIRGFQVRVLMWSAPDRLRGDGAANFRILQKTNVPLVVLTDPHDGRALAGELAGADWIVDALLGTGAQGEPRPPLGQVISQLNRAPSKRLAVDVPSGLDCDTGEPARHTFRADHTCTFVAVKPGLLVERAQPYVGDIHVLDIGVPAKMVAEVCGEG